MIAVLIFKRVIKIDPLRLKSCQIMASFLGQRFASEFPFIVLMAEILHQLRLVVYPIIYKVLAPSQVVVWDF